MNEQEDREKGRKLLTAVERLLDDTDNIIQTVEDLKHRSPQTDAGDEALIDDVGQRIVEIWSNRSAVSGGATALPAVLPGLGTLATVTGGTLLDMALVLKFEVEMTLALAWLHGFDIREERERQIAFLLASVSTYDARSGRHVFLDLAEAQGTAVWNYAPREVSKLLMMVLSRLALMGAGKGLARAIPLVGVAIGGGVNKVLTTRVGNRNREELRRRRTLRQEEIQEEDVVEAYVPGEEPAAGSPDSPDEPEAAPPETGEAPESPEEDTDEGKE